LIHFPVDGFSGNQESLFIIPAEGIYPVSDILGQAGNVPGDWGGDLEEARIYNFPEMKMACWNMRTTGNRFLSSPPVQP
jgi:hypothetical protein